MPRTEVFNREATLGSIRDLFWTKGYHGTSMQDLVDVTGLNRSSLYNSFGNKLALYKIVLEKYQNESQDIFQEALHRAEDPLQAIYYIFENLIAVILADEEGKGCFTLNCKTELSRSHQEIRRYLEKMQDKSLDFFEGLVQEGQDAELINHQETASHYAYHLYNTFQGLRMTGILTREPDVLSHIVKNALKILA